MLNSVLIVDDTEEDRYIVKWSLEKENLTAHILEARDGREALNLFVNAADSRQKYPGQFPPALILLDINMPMMNGFEFLENFAREREKNPQDFSSIIVMMFTSSELEKDRQKALQYPFVKDYLVKSHGPEGVAKTVRKHFFPAT